MSREDWDRDVRYDNPSRTESKASHSHRHSLSSSRHFELFSNTFPGEVHKE